jgi:hypothetical protein
MRVDDPMLAELVRTWAVLSAPIKVGILAMVREATRSAT